MAAPPPLNNTAAAASDTATPAYLVGWNGTAWQPVLIDTSGRIISGGTPSGVSEQVVGNVAHDAVDSSNPVKMGGYASSTPPTMVAAADRANVWVGLNGQVVIGGVAAVSADGLAANYIYIPATSGSAGNPLLSLPLVFNGSTLDRPRTPNVFKSFSAAAIGVGEVTLWTPTSGKKFRLMGYMISQGVITGAVTLRDNTAGTTILVIPPGSAGAATGQMLGNGILSAAANNVLTAQGVATETLSGYVFGTEE